MKTKHNADLYLYEVNENEELYEHIFTAVPHIRCCVMPLELKYYTGEDDSIYIVIELKRNEND